MRDKENEQQDDAKVVLRVGFGNSVCVYDAKGNTTLIAYSKDNTTSISNVEHLPAEIKPYVNEDPYRLRKILRQEHGINMPAGVGVVLGPADTRKTPLIKSLGEACEKQNGVGSFVFIRYGEPLAGYFTREVDVADAMMKAILDPKVMLIGIDSIKDILADIGGGLMARGVPRKVFKMLSQWGAVAASLGKLIIVPLNISTDDANALAEVESAVHSNTTVALVAQSTAGVFNVSSRTGEGKMRERTSITIDFNDEGNAILKYADDKLQQEMDDKTDKQVINLTWMIVDRALSNTFLD